MAGKRKKRIIRVAMIKAESKWANLKANVRLLEKLAEPLKDSQIDVLITPECFLDGYMVRKRKKCTRAKLRACSVTGADDPIIRRVARLAALLKCYVVVGASEKGDKGAIRNVAYLLGRKGGHVGSYYKTQVCEFYKAGGELPVFKTDFGTVGILICADRRWPENMRCLRLKGAEIVLNPTWGFYGDGNTAIVRTRAYENGVPLCFTHVNQSLICLGDNTIGAILESNQPSVLVHDIDLGNNPKVKNTTNAAGSHPLQNRRPALYGIISKR